MRWSGSPTASTSRSPSAAPANGTTTRGARARDRPWDCCATSVRQPMPRGRSTRTHATWSPRARSRRCCRDAFLPREAIDPVDAMEQALVVGQAIDVHADLLRHPARRLVLGEDQRDDVIDLEVRERPISGCCAGLGRDALALATGTGVPPDLDVPHTIDLLDRRTCGTEEGAGAALLHDPQSEAIVAIPVERTVHPGSCPFDGERLGVPPHVLGVGEHRVQVVEVPGPVAP